ncbi:ATP synthase subunit f, mitochondrial-like [Rhinophrynus dorsalis]
MAGRLVPLAERRLMDIKLGQLPNCLATRDFTPNGIIGALKKAQTEGAPSVLQGCFFRSTGLNKFQIGAFRRGHSTYFNKYINVKNGGIEGVAMLLAGYVFLSYDWEYDHIKHDRWRKCH